MEFRYRSDIFCNWDALVQKWNTLQYHHQYGGRPAVYFKWVLRKGSTQVSSVFSCNLFEFSWTEVSLSSTGLFCSVLQDWCNANGTFDDWKSTNLMAGVFLKGIMRNANMIDTTTDSLKMGVSNEIYCDEGDRYAPPIRTIFQSTSSWHCRWVPAFTQDSPIHCGLITSELHSQPWHFCSRLVVILCHTK
jgi:hypothetical protein